MTNRPNGTLHFGVVNDVARRAYEHRTAIGSQFTTRYGLSRLVYAEWHKEILAAIHREKNMKGWPRAWKARLICCTNPEWRDFFDDLA
jgi:putative endonuclease